MNGDEQTTQNVPLRPRILITGSSGFLGSRLVEHLAPHCDIFALDIEDPQRIFPHVNYFGTDFTDNHSVRTTLSAIKTKFGNHLDSVVHLAAHVDYTGTPSTLYGSLTVDGTRRLLTELKNFEVDQFIYLSSLLVLKPLSNGRVFLTEESPTEAEWYYPLSKIRAEQVIRMHGTSFRKVIFRVAAVYDEWCRCPVLSQQIKRIQEDTLSSHLFPGDKSHGYPFVHADDVIRAIERAIEIRHSMDDWEIFLIAEPRTLSYSTLQNEIAFELYHRSWTTVRIPKSIAKLALRAHDVFATKEDFVRPWMIDVADAHYPVAIRRARQRLGWEPQHALGKELPLLLSRLRKKPLTWYLLNHISWPGRESAQVVEARAHRLAS